MCLRNQILTSDVLMDVLENSLRNVKVNLKHIYYLFCNLFVVADTHAHRSNK